MLTPDVAPRWWESARNGRVFCGPPPTGHHIPARFHVNESGFIQCESPKLPQPLLDLKRARDSRQVAEVQRIERDLRRDGMIDIPVQDELRQMCRQAPMCARWIFLFAIRGGGVITAEVSPDERKAMEHLSTPAEMLEYLGIFPRR